MAEPPDRQPAQDRRVLAVRLDSDGDVLLAGLMPLLARHGYGPLPVSFAGKAGTFALLYTIVETFIIPLTPTKEQSFARSLLDLALPFMMAYLLLFYIIFECICNAFAELS